MTNIGSSNPKELTVHFGPPRGKSIRQNYMPMAFESIGEDRSTKPEKLFKDVTGNYLVHLPLPDWFFVCNTIHAARAHSYGEGFL